MRFFFTGPKVLGIRPGISFGGGAFRQRTNRTHSRPTETITGSFLYVIRGDHNLVKIGVSTNPSARLASLRTASAFPIDFSYIAVTPGTGFDIEAGAHEMLKSHRCNGEWFDVSPEVAVAALAGAAHKLGHPLLQTDQPTVEQILAIARSGGMPSTQDDARRHDWMWGILAGYPAWFRWIATIILAPICAVVIFGAIFIIAAIFQGLPPTR